jgi:hypothetical protein
MLSNRQQLNMRNIRNMQIDPRETKCYPAANCSEEAAMHGHVSGSDGKPAFLVEVCAYRGRDIIDKNHTDDQGLYRLEITGDGPVTILFDTHPSLTTANDWQPSMLANICVDKDQPLDRALSKVGQFMEDDSCADALAAYMFITTTQEGGEKEYAEVAASRLSQMKTPNRTLGDIHDRLLDHFRKLAAA